MDSAMSEIGFRRPSKKRNNYVKDLENGRQGVVSIATAGISSGPIDVLPHLGLRFRDAVRILEKLRPNLPRTEQFGCPRLVAIENKHHANQKSSNPYFSISPSPNDKTMLDLVKQIGVESDRYYESIVTLNDYLEETRASAGSGKIWLEPVIYTLMHQQNRAEQVGSEFLKELRDGALGISPQNAEMYEGFIDSLLGIKAG